jgi:hypothetical protein
MTAHDPGGGLAETSRRARFIGDFLHSALFNYVQTLLFLPTPLRRNACAEKMPTKLMMSCPIRFRAEDESACHEDGANLLVPPIDDRFGAAIDNLEIWRHCE